jgi:hypothetical protein
MRPLPGLLPFVVATLCCASEARSEADYSKVQEKAAGVRARWHDKVTAIDADNEAEVEAAVIANVRSLAKQWMGTKWAMGAPQAKTPGPDAQINCGTFVGTVLRDAGFVVDVKKLQRQPSQLIIESFIGKDKDRTRKFSNASMDKFLAEVKKLGPGLFIIGLDYHVGLLLQTDDDLRFIHSSYVTGTVVDEDAATASPIVDSKYRVVGKILSRANLDAWLSGERIEVVGDW